MKGRLGVLASGRGSNFLSIDEACEQGTLDAVVELVLSDRPDAPVVEKARNRGITAHVLPYDSKDRSVFEQEAAKRLEDHDCDLVILAGFMKLLSPEFVQRFKNRILNIHPSLLPAFKGLQAQKQALDYGVKISGCTVHIVTEDLDSGPILDQRAVRVKDDDTVESLSNRILTEEHELYPRVIQRYLSGRPLPEHAAREQTGK